MRKLLALFLFFFCAFSALAQTTSRPLGENSELEAVIHECGKPSAESHEISQVTNHSQRTLYYNELQLHFEPDASGWHFTTGWHGHLPISRTELEAKLPCFRLAMEEVATANAAVNPSAATTAQPQGTSASGGGIPKMWIIFGLAALLLIGLLVPNARSRRIARAEKANAKAIAEAQAHMQRRPNVDETVIQPKRPHIDPDLYK